MEKSVSGMQDGHSQGFYSCSDREDTYMYISFFKRLAGHLKRMPAKKRVVAGTLLGLSAVAAVGGAGPVASYAARTSAGAVGSAKVGVSYKPGGKAYGVVEPGYFAVTPITGADGVTYSKIKDPDYTMLIEMTETMSAMSIPDQNTSSLLFIPKMTWNNETGLSGNNSNYWVRDGSRNYGRDCSRYSGWLVRMSDSLYSGSTKDAQDHVSASGGASGLTNWKLFNNIVFCEMDKTYMDKSSNGREIGSAAVGNYSQLEIMKTGVYRDRIYKYLKKHSDVKKPDEYGYYNFNQLIDMSAKDYADFIQEVVYGGKKKNYENVNSTLLKESQQLWNAFTQITIEGGSYTTHVDRINVFTDRTYDYAITNSDVKGYFKGKKLGTTSASRSLTLGNVNDASSYRDIGLGTLGRIFNHSGKKTSIRNGRHH